MPSIGRRARLIPLLAFPVFASTFGACARAPDSPTSPFLAGDADGVFGASAGSALRGAWSSPGDHAYFPLTPGRASDFHVVLLGVGERDMRVVVGAPELFFGRMATPWVYGRAGELVPDSALLELRQYFSVSPDGDLLFHGAQNKGAMSFTEPPVRVLPARPHGGESWRDTVVFKSFLPGVGLFDSATVIFETNISERTLLRLPAGAIHAYRSTQIAIDVIRGRALPASEETGRPVAPEALKGFWFARQRGIVARDFPSGPGPGNTNIRTYALTDQGWTAIPAPQPAP